MDDLRNLQRELNRIRRNEDEEDTPNVRAPSPDSGFGSGNSSRRTSTGSNYNNPRPPPNNNDDSLAAGLIGIAGIALGAYAVGKFLFGGSNEPSSSGSARMPRIREDEEEVPVSRRVPRHASDFLNPSYTARISKEIKKDTEEYPVVGLDCQWTPTYTKDRNPVGLLQISSHKGKVALISLGSRQRVPQEIISILADKNIIKSGIETFQDGQKLLNDYSLTVKGTYDLRYLAVADGQKPDSLEKLSKKYLGVDLGDSCWQSNWDGPSYSKDQIDYAVKAAKASVDVFKKIISNIMWFQTNAKILNYCSEKLDKPFIYYSQNYNGSNDADDDDYYYDDDSD